MLKYALLGGAGALLAFVLTPWAGRLARRLGAVDEPNERRVHRGQVPSLGGVAVLAALIGALACGFLADRLLGGVFLGEPWRWGWLLGGALIVAACGVADDIWTLGPVAKLGFQGLAGVMVLAGGYGVPGITNPLTGATIDLGWMSAPVTLLWVIGITNAFNLIDGLDGLAAGVALIACATLFVVSLAVGRVEVALLAAALAGALAGFLYHNFNPATVFLGDSGALLLGYLLAIMSIRAAQKGATTVIILVPIFALGLPIMETLLSMLRRVLGAFHVVCVDPERNEYRFLAVRSASIFRADRDHIHHRLLAMGLTHRRAVLVLYVVCGLLSVTAFLAVWAKGANLAALVGVVAVAAYIGIRKLAYVEVEVLRRGALLPLFELPVLNRRALHAMIDGLFVAAAYVGSVGLSTGAWFPTDRGSRNRLLYGVVAAVCAKVVAFARMGVYERSYRHAGVADVLALLKILVAAQAASVALAAVMSATPDRVVTVAVLDFYLTATLVVGARVAFRLLEVLAEPRNHPAAVPALIYGAGSRGTAVLREFQQHPELGYRAVGFIDDLPGLRGRRINDVPVLCGRDGLAEVVKEYGVREIVLSTTDMEGGALDRLLEMCRGWNVGVRRFKLSIEDLETDLDVDYPARRAVAS